MVLKYVLKNFTRRKVRTILMILALLVSMGLIITMSATVETVRQSNVDLIASEVGRYDMAIAKSDTSSDPFLNVSEVIPLVLAANERITAVHPRIEAEVELSVNGVVDRGTLLALDPALDDIGYIDVRQDGVTSSGVRSGLIIALSDAQEWLNLPDRAQQLVATVDPTLYDTNNAETAALRVRDVVRNVQEQRRDMAVLRILGSERSLLFRIVTAEVIVIGAIGVGLGIGLGQIITATIVVPLIENQFLQQGLTSTLRPQISLSAILPAVISAFVVLILSSLKPAQDAARTKVMHAINPGVADNLQLEDLARLRERRPNAWLFVGGVVLMLIFGLIAGFQVVDAFGGPALEVMFVLLAFGLLVLGLGLMFFITTVPFERLVLLVMRLLFPRVTYFAQRNVGRGQLRNTLISLLVLFSGVLPSFQATQMALENANYETTTRLNMGAPVNIRSFGYWGGVTNSERLKPSFLTDELGTVPGLGEMVGISYGYQSRATDPVGLRSAQVTVVGVNGRLQDVLFADMVEFAAGDPDAFAQLLADPTAVIISEGLARQLVV